jgi:hypothetical protein
MEILLAVVILLSHPVDTPVTHDVKTIKRTVIPPDKKVPGCKNGRHPSGEPMKLCGGLMLI